ncbi:MULTISPECIES: hypothetical protein [unclassified Rhizobacter]|uniref:hypothetical protein n=1 Tax=unclassified Rhizobacter TaxID=2640088 RepID=UPI0009EC610D|nr:MULTISPECIES: hypothetical protein [unclassified Rhizobacter]
MYRCVIAATAALAFACAALPASAQVQSDPQAPAQAQRPFPRSALRGVIAFDNPPQVTLNGKPAQLAPGVRIRGQNNLLVLTGPLVGSKLVVHYTTEFTGLIKDVWILRDEEIKVVPWPTTVEQTQAWSFDQGAQVWTKP